MEMHAESVAAHALVYVQLEVGRMMLCSTLRRLLSSFQNSLEEMTIIARPTDDSGTDAVRKAVQLKSYNDPSRGGHHDPIEQQLRNRLQPCPSTTSCAGGGCSPVADRCRYDHR